MLPPETASNTKSNESFCSFWVLCPCDILFVSAKAVFYCCLSLLTSFLPALPLASIFSSRVNRPKVSMIFITTDLLTKQVVKPLTVAIFFVTTASCVALVRRQHLIAVEDAGDIDRHPIPTPTEMRCMHFDDDCVFMKGKTPVCMSAENSFLRSTRLIGGRKIGIGGHDRDSYFRRCRGARGSNRLETPILHFPSRTRVKVAPRMFACRRHSPKAFAQLTALRSCITPLSPLSMRVCILSQSPRPAKA